MARGKSENGESNMGMVRAAIGVLGPGAKPLEIQQHIKEKFNKELPPQIISNYKFQIKKASGTTSGRRGRKPGSAGGLQISDFEVIRGLVTRLGADQVKRLVDVVT